MRLMFCFNNAKNEYRMKLLLNELTQTSGVFKHIYIQEQVQWGHCEGCLLVCLHLRVSRIWIGGLMEVWLFMLL